MASQASARPQDDTAALKRALVKSEDGHEFLNQGNLGQARTSLKLSVSIQEEELAKQYDALASLHIKEGDYEEALKEYRKSLLILEQHHSSSSPCPAQPLLAKCLMNIGNVMEKLEDYPGAINYHRQALAICQKLQPISKQVADLHKTIARILLSNTNNEEGALHELNLAHHIRQELKEQQTEVISLSDNGDADFVLSDETKARRVSFEPHGNQESPQSMTNVQEVVDSMSSVTTSNETTNCRCRDNGSGSKEYVQSENRNSSDQGHKDGMIQEDTLAATTKDPNIIRQGATYGTAKNAHRESENLDSASRPAPSDRTIPSTPSPATRPSIDILTAVNKGEELLEQNNLEEALDQFRLALAGYNLSKQPDLLAVATTHSNIGLILSKQGQYEDALLEYRRALLIREDESPDSLLVASSCEDIALLLERMQENSRFSLHYFERAIFITRRFGRLDKDLAMLYSRAGEINKKLGDPQAALSEYRMAAEIVENVESTSLYLADLHVTIGDLLWEQGEAKAAIESFERALVIHEQHGVLSTDDAAEDIRARIRTLSSDGTEMDTMQADGNESASYCGTAASDWEHDDKSDDKETQEMLVECLAGTISSVAMNGSKRTRTMVSSDGITHDDDEDNATTHTAEDVAREPVKKRARLPTDRFSPECSSQASTKIWTKEEERTLWTKRQIGMSYGEIAKILPGRTKKAVFKHCHTLGINKLTSKGPPEWAEAEDTILRKEMSRLPKPTYEEIAMLLPSRSAAACSSRASKLGLSRPKARDSAISSKEAAAATTSRSERARPLTTRKNPLAWTEEENSILRNGVVQGLSYDEIAKLLPKRNGKACESRYYRMSREQKTASPPHMSKSTAVPTQNTSSVGFIAEMDTIFRKAREVDGLVYDEIAKLLPGDCKSGNAIRMHYRRALQNDPACRGPPRHSVPSKTRKHASWNDQNCEKESRFSAEDVRLVRQSRLTSFSRPRNFS